jgi:hypothetical protein
VFDASLAAKARHIYTAMSWTAVAGIHARITVVLRTDTFGAALVNAPLSRWTSIVGATVNGHLGILDALPVVAEPLLQAVAVGCAALEAAVIEWSVRKH